MAKIPGSVEWISELVPDLAERISPFTVATDEVDDELIEVFMDELQRLTGELQDGLATSDSEMVRSAAHSIKGMGGTIGLPEISVLALDIEFLSKNNQLDESRPLVEGLAKWVGSIT